MENTNEFNSNIIIVCPFPPFLLIDPKDNNCLNF